MSYLALGLFSGAAVSLIAIGFVFINNVIDTYPFHLGALAIFLGFSFYELDSQFHNLGLALLLTFAIGLTISYLLSVGVFEPLLGRHFPSLVAGVGLLIIFDELVGQFFNSGQPVSFPDSLRVSGAVEIFGAKLATNRIVVFGVAILLVVLLDLFFQRTRGGMAMRALADSRKGAQLCSVSPRRTVRMAFLMAGVSITCAAILIGLLQPSISASLGDTLTISALAAALLGGGTSLRGAVLGSMVLGVAQGLSIGYISSSFSQAVAYLVMIVILLVRPNGLWGRVRETRA